MSGWGFPSPVAPVIMDVSIPPVLPTPYGLPMTDVRDPRRLRAVERSGLLDSPPEEPFERMTRLASRLTDAPIALISVLDHNRQFFKSALGMPEGLRETPLSHSFCQYVVEGDGAFVVPDSRADDQVRDNPAIEDLGVEAYCGVPLWDADGHILGAFCVIDTHPREWTPEHQHALEDLAHGFHTEMRLRRRVEELEDRTDYLRMVVHDLRAPLSIVSSVTRTLGSLVDDEPAVAELTAAAQRQNNRMRHLIDGLLATGALEQAELGADVDLSRLVEHVAADVAGILRPGQRIETDAAEPVVAVGHPTLLEQGLLNLVGNALVHNPGGVTVRVGAETTDDHAVMTVSDDGRGLPGGGDGDGPLHGLGLAIAHRVVEAHGGTISSGPSPEGGAAFRIALPRPTPSA